MPCLAVLCVAVAVRLAYFTTTRSPAFDDPLIDGDYYDYLGLRLAMGDGFEPGPFWQPPLYPLLLSWLYRAFGHDLLWPRLLQTCLDAGTAVLTTRLATQLTANRGWGVAAGLSIALYGPMVFYAGEILPTTAAAFCAMLTISFASVARPRAVHGLGCGLSVGAGALLTPPLLIVIVPIAWVLRRERQQLARLAFAACLLVVGSATLANWVRARELVLISANGGINLYIGNARDSDHLVAVRPGAQWEALMVQPFDALVTSASGQDAYFVLRALSACSSDPLACTGRLLGKTRQLMSSREIPRNESIELIARDAFVLRALTPRLGSAVLPFALLLPLAAAGLVVALRRRERATHVVALSALSIAAAIVMFFVTGRYRIPLVPPLVVLAALGGQAMQAALRALRAREPTARTAELSTAAIALVFAAWPLQLPIDAVPFEAEMHYVIGGRRARLGDDPGAVAAWQTAVRLEPGYLEASFNLGLAHERLGQSGAAAAVYRDLLRAHPGDGPTLDRLAELAQVQSR